MKSRPHPEFFKTVLEDDLILLRPLVENDFDDLYAVASDEKIWEQHPESKRHEIEVFDEFFKHAIIGNCAYVVIDKESNQIIGSSRYRHLTNKSVEIGWTFLSRRHWGGRYNRHMKKCMIDHAFSHYETLILFIGPTNFRSQKATEKIGAFRDMKMESELREFAKSNWAFVIQKENWEL